MSRRDVVLALDDDGRGFGVEAASAGIDRVIRRARGPAVAGIVPVRVTDRTGNETDAAWIRIASAADVGRAVEASAGRFEFVVVECSDWKVIPLENMIGEFRRRGKKLYAYVRGREDVDLAFSVLEKGVDGVVVPPGALEAAKRLAEAPAPASFELVPARVTRLVDAGLGDRVCVDTTSQLSSGEGMLVGSRAAFLFLIHGETIATQYIPPRSFRVNAGSVHSYLQVEGERTRYLSELEAGDPVLIVSSEGASRHTVVGRVKIERRPMTLVEATVDGEKGSVILQNAETIRVVRPGGDPVAVTELKVGDEVLVHARGPQGRHFGGAVDEFIIER